MRIICDQTGDCTAASRLPPMKAANHFRQRHYHQENVLGDKVASIASSHLPQLLRAKVFHIMGFSTLLDNNTIEIF
jgi:hypothetical protein